MEYTPNILSIVPPLLALLFVLWKKQIVPALLLGGLSGSFILSGYDIGFFYHFLNKNLQILGQRGNMELILFSLLIGGLIKGMEKNGGFKGFISLLEKKKAGNSVRTAYGLTWLIGITLFLENWSNILINGTATGPIYKKLGISKAKLAYFIHTISINLVALILINSWGAFYMTLLEGQNVDNSFFVILKSIPFNFYCIISLIVVALAMIFNINLGPMKRYKDKEETEVEKTEKEEYVPPKKSVHLIMPLLVMIFTLIATLYITGEGSITSGSGTTAVFFAVITSIVVHFFYIRITEKVAFQDNLKTIYNGVGELIPLGVLLVLALTLGRICMEIGTGVYIANFTDQNLPLFIIPAVFFLLSCIISFATGTSYGTFSIMIPLAVPLALVTGIDLPLIFAACISGGVFGDNCSPISDTSIVTGLAAKIDVVDHIKTQIPYALVSASIATVLFVIAGLIMI